MRAATTLLALALAVTGVRAAETGGGGLLVRWLDGPPGTVALARIELAATQVVEVRDDDGKMQRFRCTTLGAMLEGAGIPLGRALRGPRLAEYALVRARDGYRAVFALAELDAGISERPVHLCVARDGAPLAAGEGPLRLVIPAEKRRARWVRDVVEVSVQVAD